MSNTQATARLAKEVKDFHKHPVQGLKVELENDDLFKWTVFIAGPDGTPYEGGIFKSEMTFPDDYPNSPPKLKVLSQFWHPNVYPDGNVCISILHTPDPMNPQESADETWRPIHTGESVLVSVLSMLSDPNYSSPANVDASVELRKKPEAFNKRVKELVARSVKELPSGFEMPKPKKPAVEAPSDFLDDFDAMDHYDDFEDYEDDDEEDYEEDED